MNIALEKTEEHVNGTKKWSFGDAFVRGNNGEALPNSWYLFPMLSDSLTVMYISAD